MNGQHIKTNLSSQLNPIITGGGGGGGGGRGGGCGTIYHRVILLSRTLEQQMILNLNFMTFNIFLW